MENHLNDSGYLDVGDGHQIYWEDWGNKTARPIMYLHGGPGAGFSESNKTLFDPDKHHVIFHDQRGSGRSTPSTSTDHNTTQDLISDVEKLKNHLGITGKTYVAGGSWGSTLSLCYAIAHPESVEKLLIWSVYLARQFETDYVNEGYPRYSFPEAWEQFISLVPEEHRSSGTSIMQYYAEKMRSDDTAMAKKYADEWTLWEYTLCTINYDQDVLEQQRFGNMDNLAIARLETHYFMNGSFVPENYILDNIDKIRAIPCFIAQGRFDMCTPPVTAYELAKAYGEKANLQWVRSGHLRSDPEMFTTLQTLAHVEFVE